ncbi:hypothetical protein HU200_021716 [Digitaria exilis]|uniref:Uncharacterized protein n=1 Tax=Digitaria exilis TaxID=1010633 RepID=A0A835EZN3_9POAL|nr:hypothetical protein HU200_021716 [Digitaria exilis]
MFGFSSVFPDGGGRAVLPTFKIFCKAEENFCLSARDGAAVLAPADPNDEHQHWYKDKRFGTLVKDEEGKHAFSLINKATNLSIQHPGGLFRPVIIVPVKLVPFDWDSFDNTLMWTMSDDLGNDDFRFIRTLNDISLKLTAFHRAKGVAVAIKRSDSCDGDYQHWKSALERRVLRDRCGRVMLDYARLLDLGHEETGCEEDVALVCVKLVPYDPHYLDRSVLWSKSGEIMKDFHYIRMVDNIYLNLDIRDKGHHDYYHSRVQDGTKAMLSYRCEGDNQYWRMVPWSKSLHSTLHKLLFVAIAFS